MPSTSLVLLSLILSSLMRHQRLLARFCLFFLSGFASAAFSLSDPLIDFKLFGRDVDVGDPVAFCASSRGADVGPAVGHGLDDWDESDCTDGESSVGMPEGDDPCSVTLDRLTPDTRGLCTADRLGVPCMLYAPSVPNECGVEYGTG